MLLSLLRVLLLLLVLHNLLSGAVQESWAAHRQGGNVGDTAKSVAKVRALRMLLRRGLRAGTAVTE